MSAEHRTGRLCCGLGIRVFPLWRAILTLWLELTLLPTVSGGELLKWIDDHGQIHYGDSLPPNAAPLEREILNPQAVPLKTIRPEAPSPRGKVGDAADTDEAKQRADQQASYDHFLRQTFGTVEALKSVRDRRIAAMDAEVSATEVQIAKLKVQLAQLLGEAAGRERRAEAVPDALLTAMEATRTQIQNSVEFIEIQERKRADVDKKYAKDLHRLEELTLEEGETRR